jgi:hypothetical protein
MWIAGLQSVNAGGRWDAVRHPLQKLHPMTQAGLVEIARQLDPMVLRWDH